MAMRYLDVDRLESLDTAAFRAREPYPWINPEGVLTDEGFDRLRSTLPDLSPMTPMFGVSRAHGQQSHDRYALEYDRGLDVDGAWHEFVAELRSTTYTRFPQRMLARRFVTLNFHWHYTPRGCSVSPHCDAKHKLGSHILYFNTAEDWHSDWGGQTLILDDGGRFSRRSSPRFEDFDSVTAAECVGNRSLLFARQDRSWHGVEEIRAPDPEMHRVFIIVINDPVRVWRRNAWRRLWGKPRQTY